MVSFDVESLFTNIPTNETIEIILRRAFDNNEKTYYGLEKEDLKQLLVICTQNSHFQFNGEYFDQIDGVAMGSPLGPLFANIFMSEFERNHMNILKELGVVRWHRYVDDIFATLKDKSSADEVLKFINTRHPNLKFTIEHEQNNKLPFLDTLVKRDRTRYTTTLYHKPTFTGVYLNWTSLTARRYKIGLIHCLLDRIWKICTEEKEKKSQIVKLKAILAKNDYPVDIVNKEIESFIEKRNTTTPIETDSSQLTKEKEKEKRYIVLPYVSNKVEGFAKRLKELVSSTYSKVDFNVAFKTPNEIGKLFPFKDRTLKREDQTLVVYKITCKECKQSYIGKTKRSLSTRIKEHQNTTSSACFRHAQDNPGHHMDYDNVEILDSADSDFKLQIKELLHILKRKPALNKQLNSQSNFDVKTLIIAAHPHLRK